VEGDEESESWCPSCRKMLQSGLAWWLLINSKSCIMCIVLSFKYKWIIAFGRWGSFLPSCKMPPCVLVHYYYFAMVKHLFMIWLWKLCTLSTTSLLEKRLPFFNPSAIKDWWRPRKRKRKRKVRSHVTQQPFAIGCWGAQVDKMHGAAFPR